MKAIYALSVLAAAASALSFKADPFWKAYKSTFHKTYENDAEEARRYEVFNQNMQKAAKYNSEETMAEYGMTSVSDRFPEEIFTKFDLPEEVPAKPEPTAEEVAALPTTFDARSYGWVPAVRSQGQCGSCWAFTTIASIAIAHAKQKGTSLILSEQQLVDCSTGDHGCSGGWPLTAAKYAKGGVTLDSIYPYVAYASTCRYSSSQSRTKVASTDYTGTSVNAMKTAIQKYGSLMVALNADKAQSYYGGIMTASNCPTDVNHGVNIVGWGVSGTTEYWIVRNSWGSWWGENGYFRIVTGKNACGIERYPMYVTVA